MARTIQSTKRAEIPPRSDNTDAHAAATPGTALQFDVEWNPRLAWQLRTLWGPVARAVESIVVSSCLQTDSSSTSRILAIGKHARTLGAMLAPSTTRTWCFDVHVEGLLDEPSLPFTEKAFDCAVAFDWLPFLRSSERKQAVAELCRVARTGVVLTNPFYSPEVVAAERALNGLYVASTGADNLELRHHIENGLPDIDSVRKWLGTTFAHVLVEPIEALANWQLLTSVEAIESYGSEVGSADVAAAALLPPVDSAIKSPAYRTLVAASSSPMQSIARPEATTDLSAMVTNLAIEAACQRRAVGRLANAIANERDVLGEQQRNLQNGRDAIDVHVRNLENEREALHSRIRNLESEREALDKQVQRRKNELDATNTHVTNLEAERAAKDIHIEQLQIERDSMSSQVMNLQGEQVAMAIRIRKLENERDMLSIRSRNLENERNGMDTQVKSLEAERDAMRVHITNLENERNATNVHVGNLENEREATKVHVRNLENAQAALSARLGAQEGENGTLHFSANWKRRLLQKD